MFVFFTRIVSMEIDMFYSILQFDIKALNHQILFENHTITAYMEKESEKIASKTPDEEEEEEEEEEDRVAFEGFDQT